MTVWLSFELIVDLLYVMKKCYANKFNCYFVNDKFGGILELYEYKCFKSGINCSDNLLEILYTRRMIEEECINILQTTSS